MECVSYFGVFQEEAKHHLTLHIVKSNFNDFVIIW